MSFVEAAVIAVPTENKDAYINMATSMATRAKECGALAVMEAWGDDVPDGELTSFIKSVQATKDETIILSWIIWPDQATRDAGRPKIMEGMGPNDFPFDPTRMIFGGFTPIVEA